LASPETSTRKTGHCGAKGEFSVKGITKIMSLANWKVRTRLGAGFGVVLLLMAALIAVGIAGLRGMDGVARELIGNERAKSDAALAVDAAAQAGARNTMASLLAAPGAAPAAQAGGAGLQGLGESLAALEKLIDASEAKAVRARSMNSWGRPIATRPRAWRPARCCPRSMRCATS
jgi:hypothetical protein